MTKEKQIEEMARDLENHACMSEYHAEIASKILYNAGYRKATDVAREIFEEIEEHFKAYEYFDAYGFDDLVIDIAELKKKYTGGWKKRDCSNCKNRNEEGCSFGNMCITSNSPYATPSHWKAKESEDTE